ncbi:sulfate adenylyltransferase [Tenacibaculum holothuriorum]|uniref:sulfate adenylyltransferase n=1 Tax=Tenacibaculum holothuriorum TaxID=1635173 RepID=A0A1Y2PC89_9FLAO|nr:GTP-binding protein [Tenacibaculum holothuriorum]OSY88096.1 sulfate adenylyltransferase [Tenacibaculum holothuriorum]
MNVLKIATAGSVDDGKSTLIGRILYDTNSLTEDKLQAIEEKSAQRGFDYLDFSLATDGLVAEREQGITIDVAHIYFSTPKTSFIIADTPGHIEYTRNMVTGASNSQASIILVDARNGVVEQTYRHFFINNLLRVKEVIVAVNKMDLVDYSEEKFNQIKGEIEYLAEKSGFKDQQLTFIPISALQGDNVVNTSTNISWYQGKSLLEYLENIEIESTVEEFKTRFPIQTVIRPKTENHHDYRGYAGKLYGGSLAVGDEVTVLPSATQSKVKSIEFFQESFQEATPGSAITVTLENDVNLSRGDMLVKKGEEPQVVKQLDATICWMDKEPLKTSDKYYVKHGVNDAQVKITGLDALIHTDFSGEEEQPSQLSLNEIGKVQLKLSKPLFIDTYAENKSNGAFILINPKTNNTSGVGFIN